MKFCDGQGTLEQIVTNLLNQHSHLLDALNGPSPNQSRPCQLQPAANYARPPGGALPHKGSVSSLGP
jgi:hypothetical protein